MIITITRSVEIKREQSIWLELFAPSRGKKGREREASSSFVTEATSVDNEVLWTETLSSSQRGKSKHLLVHSDGWQREEDKYRQQMKKARETVHKKASRYLRHASRLLQKKGDGMSSCSSRAFFSLVYSSLASSRALSFFVFRQYRCTIWPAHQIITDIWEAHTILQLKKRGRERRPQRARKWYEQLTTRHGLHRGREKNRYPSERKMKFSSCPFWVVSITLESSADRREVFNWLDEIKKRLDHFFFQAYLGRRFAREHNKHVLLSRRFSAHSRLCSRPVRMPYVRQKSDTTSRSSVDKANSRFFLSLIQT